MLSGKQIGVILSVAVVVTALYLLPVKGLVTPEKAAASGEEAQSVTFSAAQLAETEKQNINPGLLVEIEGIEKELADSPGDTALLRQLAGEWNELHVSNVSGLYFLELAEKQPSPGNWMKAGDRLRDAYKATDDTLQRNFLVDKALLAYGNALELQPENLDAQTGLGAVTVEGTPNPMSGIQLLLGVVEKDPENPKANLTLGVFSIQSGQYEKARDRLLTVVKSAPGGEAYFYLGEAYRNLGEKEKAAEAYETTKKYIVDPQFTAMIDNIIKKLK